MPSFIYFVTPPTISNNKADLTSSIPKISGQIDILILVNSSYSLIDFLMSSTFSIISSLNIKSLKLYLSFEISNASIYVSWVRPDFKA
jgi:hypothetical protein